MNEDLRGLRLFNQKASKLEALRFTQLVRQGRQGVRLGLEHGRVISLDRAGPTQEDLDAFVLTFRFFVQNNEPSSFANVTSVYESLEYLRRADVAPDERVTEAIDLVASKSDGDGRWPLEVRYPGEMPVEMDDGEDRPSRWNTLRALRVLDWYSAGDQRRRPWKETGNEPDRPVQ